MSYYTKEKLYQLIPAIYRQEDAKIGKPLEALVSLIAEQVEILEKDIENLYDNWFIETCEEWLVPYIGDLVGAMLLISIEKATVSQRAWVANTIRYRRRKGTITVLEQIARDVTGWNAKAVEFFQLLALTQYVNNHLRLGNYYTPDLRDTEKLELLDTPFDTVSHTLDVRAIKSGRGYHNIPNVGIFLWRLQSYPVNNSPAYDQGDGRYSFSQLGFDIQVFNSPVTETDIAHPVEELNAPIPIRRSALKNRLDKYYGSGNGKSLLVQVDGSTISSDNIMVCNLDNWIHRPPEGKVAIDPALGRIAFPTTGTGSTPHKVRVSYYYGFSADIGGGFYDRDELEIDLAIVPKTYKVAKDTVLPDAFSTISEAILHWQNIDNRPSAIFEIMDSEFYPESFSLAIPEKRTLVIRSTANQRPVLKANPDAGTGQQFMEVTGAKNSRLMLDGLLVDKSLGIKINPGELGSLSINHCTLAPGINAALMLDSGNDDLVVTLRRSISGKIAFTASEAKLTMTDSIVDVKAAGVVQNLKSDDTAIECFNAKIENSTIFGKLNVNMLELASNSIFTDTVKAKRRQQGCVRFSYVPEGSEVPRRYHCQPDIQSSNLQTMNSDFAKVHPWFTSENYADPGYAQLHKYIAAEIFDGADNEAEMGAFNSLYEPQRIKNLESSLDEYLRFGLETGIILADVRKVN